MASTWYFRRNDQQVGPISSAALRQMAAVGMLAPDDLVAKDVTGPWVPASRVKGLFASSNPNNSIPEESTSSKSSLAQTSDGIDSDRPDKAIESPTASRPLESLQHSTSHPCVTPPDSSANVHDTTSPEAPSTNDRKTPASVTPNTLRMSSTIPAFLNSERNKKQLDALEDFLEWIRSKAVTFSIHTLIPATKWGFQILYRFAATAWSQAKSRFPSNPSFELAASSDPSASVNPFGQAPSQSPDEMVNTLASNNGGSSLNADGLSKPNLWNPTAALLWGLLFSWVFSVVLLGLNWRALRNRQGFTRCLYWLAAIIPYGLLAWAMGSESVLVTIGAWGLYLGVALYEYRPQAALLSHDFEDSYIKRKWTWPIAIGASIALLGLWQPAAQDESTASSEIANRNSPSIDTKDGNVETGGRVYSRSDADKIFLFGSRAVHVLVRTINKSNEAASFIVKFRRELDPDGTVTEVPLLVAGDRGGGWEPLSDKQLYGRFAERMSLSHDGFVELSNDGGPLKLWKVDGRVGDSWSYRQNSGLTFECTLRGLVFFKNPKIAEQKGLPKDGHSVSIKILEDGEEVGTGSAMYSEGYGRVWFTYSVNAGSHKGDTTVEFIDGMKEVAGL